MTTGSSAAIQRWLRSFVDVAAVMLSKGEVKAVQLFETHEEEGFRSGGRRTHELPHWVGVPTHLTHSPTSAKGDLASQPWFKRLCGWPRRCCSNDRSRRLLSFVRSCLDRERPKTVLLSSLKYRRQTELGRMNERALDCAEPRAAPCRCEHQASRRLARVAWLCRCV